MIKSNIKYKLITINFLFFCILMKAYAEDPVSTTKLVENATTITVIDCQNDIDREIGTFLTNYSLVINAIQNLKIKQFTKIHVQMYYKEIEAAIEPDDKMLRPKFHCTNLVQKEIQDEVDKMKKGSWTGCVLGYFACGKPNAKEDNEQDRIYACLNEIQSYFPSKMQNIDILKHALMDLSLSDFGQQRYVKNFVTEHLVNHFQLPRGLKKSGEFCNDFVKNNINTDSTSTTVNTARGLVVSPPTIVETVTTAQTVDECQNDIFSALMSSSATYYLVRKAIIDKKFEQIAKYNAKVHVMMYYKEIEANIVPGISMSDPYDHCLTTVQRELMDLNNSANKGILDAGIESLYSFFSYYGTTAVKQNEEIIRMRICLGELYSYFSRDWKKIDILKHALTNLSVDDFGQKHYVTEYLKTLPENCLTPDLKEPEPFCQYFIQQTKNVKPDDNFNSALTAVKKARDEYISNNIKIPVCEEKSQDYIEEQLMDNVEKVANKIAKRRNAALQTLKKEKVSEEKCIQDITFQISDSQYYESVVNAVFKFKTYSEIETFHVREYCEKIRSIIIPTNLDMPDIYCEKIANHFVDELEKPPPQTFIQSVGNAGAGALNTITTQVGWDVKTLASSVTNLPNVVPTALSSMYTTTPLSLSNLTSLMGTSSGTASASSPKELKNSTASAPNPQEVKKSTPSAPKPEELTKSTAINLGPEELEKKKKEESKKKRDLYTKICKDEMGKIFNLTAEKTAKDIMDDVFINFNQNDLRENTLGYSREYMWTVIQSWYVRSDVIINGSNSDPDDPDSEGLKNSADKFLFATEFCKEYCKNN